MSWAPKTLYQVVAERAATRGGAEALVTASAREHTVRAFQLDARPRAAGAAR